MSLKCRHFIQLIEEGANTLARDTTSNHLTKPSVRPGNPHGALLERHFGYSVRFKADRNALLFCSSELDHPFVTHNEELVTMNGTQVDSELKAQNAKAFLGREAADAARLRS